MHNVNDSASDVLEFIKRCVQNRKIFWTYHVTMRMRNRHISRELIVESSHHYEIIEENPADKYLPSYLVHAEYHGEQVHILFAVDREEENVRIITAYRPSADEWQDDMKTRRQLS